MEKMINNNSQNSIQEKSSDIEYFFLEHQGQSIPTKVIYTDENIKYFSYINSLGWVENYFTQPDIEAKGVPVDKESVDTKITELEGESQFIHKLEDLLYPDKVEIVFWELARKNFPSIEYQKELRNAIKIVKQYHNHQYRDEGTPYYTHLLAVASICMQHKGSFEDIISCILHDSLEDTNISQAKIQESFGDNVLKNIILLSKEVEGKKITDEEYYSHLENNLDTLKLKGFDRIHNLYSLYFQPDDEKKERYIKQTKQKIIPLFEKYFPEIAKNMLEIIQFLETNLDKPDFIQNRLNDLQKIQKIQKSI